jgi:hypothetical protein
METLQTISLIVSGVSAFVAAQLKFYRWSYSQGYSHGQHSGFTQGLWKAAERSKRNETEYLNI